MGQVVSTEIDLSFFVGEFFDPIEIQLVDEENALVDLTNVTNITFEMFQDKNKTIKVLDKAGSKDNLTSVMKVDLVEADTKNLPAGDYIGRFKFEDNSKIRYAPQAGEELKIRLVK